MKERVKDPKLNDPPPTRDARESVGGPEPGPGRRWGASSSSGKSSPGSPPRSGNVSRGDAIAADGPFEAAPCREERRAGQVLLFVLRCEPWGRAGGRRALF